MIRFQLAFFVMVVMMLPPAADAQNFGAGPLTSTLTDTEPTTGTLTWGRVRLAPGMTVQELGTDDNVFDEKVDPKSDWVFRGTPDVSMFTRLRFAQLSTYVGSELAYYHKYSAERSAGVEGRGRLDLLLGRLRPFFGAGHTNTRTRPNAEIDVRAKRRLEEVSGGVGYELGQYNHVFAGLYRYRIDYRNAFEEGVDLSRTLNMETTKYMAGIRTAVTPLAMLTLQGGFQEDRFEELLERNTDRNVADATLKIGTEAVLSGEVSVSYQWMEPRDPLVRPFRGITSTIGVTYPFLEVGRVTVSFIRGFNYSFDVDEAYYKEMTGNLVYTHRLGGNYDLQLRGSLSAFDYGFRQGVPHRRDKLDSAAGSLGYNLRNRTRIAVNYESARRRSPVFDERDYDRHRWFFSWLYAF